MARGKEDGGCACHSSSALKSYAPVSLPRDRNPGCLLRMGEVGSSKKGMAEHNVLNPAIAVWVQGAGEGMEEEG